MTEHRETRAGNVAIVGRPNVGKSTLLNRLVGQKLSITSRKPQTTRHRIRGIVSTQDGQCVFVDTPGFQSDRMNALGGAMNRSVTRALAEVDVAVLVLVAGRYTPDDDRVVRLLPKTVPVIVAVNKVDRLRDRSALLPGEYRRAWAHAPSCRCRPEWISVDTPLREIMAACRCKPASCGPAD
jgi:GTP-binding protein Era